MPEIQKKKIQFQSIIDALLDDDADFPEYFLPSFSDIEGKEFTQLVSIWNQITPERKARLFEHLEILNDTDTLMDFNNIAQLALTDPNAVVRASGIRMLWDYENEKNIPVLIELLKNDIDQGVRAEAAGALGKYIYLGEIDEISQSNLKIVEKELLRVMRSSESELVRQKALEALGFSCREEVPSMIMNAFQSGDENWLIYAISAMGRSADQVWSTQVFSMLAHPELKVQIEAVKAAGELEIKQAKKILLKFILESESDEDLWVQSIWALSKIGGENVQKVFEKLLEKAETEEDQEFLKEAMDNLYLTNGIAANFELLNLEEPDEGQMHEFDINEGEIDLDALENTWIEDLEESLEDELEGSFDEDSDEEEDDELEDGYYLEDLDSGEDLDFDDEIDSEDDEDEEELDGDESQSDEINK
ncbi:MAG: hypothetical protein CVU46_15905 [Chloroflexi bacterium HGW-Chloroflexi-8]|jgi:HEAT repeat protein|nr:MAG: hypothetical protein CVU46_15905 [Chloroflexi bacterium HGW-Chloroflexi-8]